MAEQTNYDAGNIQVLEGLEAVRMRPGMYIGSTSARGLHHLVYEVVDNSVDEALAGYATHIEVTICEDNSIEVIDDGRGIPTGMHETGMPAVELVLSKLHAGGKFGGGGYKVSGGLHGVGISVVNALSEWTIVDVYQHGKIQEISFERGNKTSDLKEIGTTDRTGTTVRFKPDAQIFETTIFEFDVLKTRLQELAFLNKGLRITLSDKRGEGRSESFHYEGGLVQFIEYLNEAKEAITPSVISIDNTRDDVVVDVALQYNDSYSETILSFVNNINTIDGGTHLSGFRTALTRTLNDYGRKAGILKENESNLTGEDVREGLTAVVSVKVLEPQFEGQTKGKLGNSEVKGITDTIVSDGLRVFLEEHPAEAKKIIEKATNASRAREEARLDKILANAEIRSMITAFGTGIGQDFDITKSRYNKIIIMTDADVDGAHIRTLLLTFFYRYMRPLIEEGHVFIAQPPLYQIKKGQKQWYAYSDQELSDRLDEIGRENITIQRYKGLGEMNAEQLWDTTMNPEHRTILQVSMEDSIAADKIFSVLMGDKVEPRRKFIEDNAEYVRNLDL